MGWSSWRGNERLVLALAFILFGTMVAQIHLPRGLTAPTDVSIKTIANMTSIESISSNATEVDGIRFEILLPEPVWPIPENRPGAETPVQVGLRMTNQTPKPVRFTRFDPIMVVGLGIVAPNGLRLQSQAIRGMLLGSVEFAACPLVLPGESLTFFQDAKLFWRDNKLLLRSSDTLGAGEWYFEMPGSGTYQVQFLYNNSSAVIACYKRDINNPEILVPTISNDLWTGQAFTPFVQIRLVAS